MRVPLLTLSLLLSLPAWAEDGFAYVKVVDRGGFTDSQMTPGSDIDAVELVRDGVVVARADRVLEAQLGQGDHGNAATRLEAALGVPDHRSRTITGFVSLGGPGGWLVLHLSEPARDGDLVRVHEIGGAGGRAEHTEVCVASSPRGPFVSLGSGFGIFEVLMKPGGVQEEGSACRGLVNT